MKELINFFEINKGFIGFLTTVVLFVIGYALNHRARRIQALMLFKEFRDPLIKFANEAIDTMTELEGLCECNPQILKQDFFDRYNLLISKVSSLRDKGKLIIPNTFPEIYGTHKAEAYQGFRHEVLDCLAAAFHLATSINFTNEGYNKASVKIEIEKFEKIHKLSNECEEYQSLKQIEKIKKGLDKLPDGYSIDGSFGDNDIGNGWSSKKAIVECKRQFVSKVQKLIKARNFSQKLIELSDKKV
ncbi:MAG: hypothetical protein MUF42_17180 [Cytophagaceae bacterium]|jgi:hypothetical protein|nr:hypothetical protein [Cytophagaceae bacterium]